MQKRIFQNAEVIIKFEAGCTDTTLIVKRGPRSDLLILGKIPGYTDQRQKGVYVHKLCGHFLRVLCKYYSYYIFDLSTNPIL